MEFIESEYHGSRLIGLRSGPASGQVAVLHIHGYGGDFYSNAFVREAHVALEGAGVTFLSTALPTTGFLLEDYSDNGVSYRGSALTDPAESVAYVVESAGRLRRDFDKVVLQGHSFGTNLVRQAMRVGADAQAAIYLSAADSVQLLESYRERIGPRAGNASPQNQLDWETFGVLADDRFYAIPIFEGLLNRLLESEVFTTWSSLSEEDLDVPSLFVSGSRDPIAQGAGFWSRIQASYASRATTVELDTASHSFVDCLSLLLNVIVGWIGGREVVGSEGSQ